MAGYRDTLNLPRTEFPMKGDLPRREPERLAWWKARDLYAKLRAARRDRPVLMLHDGPPYSNGHLHMGTASNKVWKDAVVRTASILGFDSPYLPGWDNHGMPIEINVSRALREEGVTADRVALRKRCRAYATEWVGIQRAEFERLGGWGEWDHPYLTMDTRFEAEILETFAALAAKGYVQRGLRSIHWCPTDRTALAEAEIEYQDDPSPSVHVLFPIRRDPNGVLGDVASLHALAWTTTPWTLPANRGLMVDPDAEYVEAAIGTPADAGTRRLIVAAARAEAVREAARAGEARIGRRWKGRELIGVVCEAPWGNDAPIVDGTPFVSMEDGTGLVHTAPGHGKEDFVVGQRAGLEVACPVDEAGRFTAGAEPFVGERVIDPELNQRIVARLREQGRLFASGTLTHAYPHCWRCRQPVIFRATKQWFMIIDHDGHRTKALAAIERDVRWEPPSSQNRIRDAVRLRPDWCLSRQRSWGVGIPAVYCESCGEATLDPGVMRQAAALTREHGSDAWYELPVERFLRAGLRCPACHAAGPFRKETDILDVWFDAGSTWRAAQVTHPGFAAAWTRAWRPAAGGAPGRIVYFEGPDQHRGWFNSSLMIGVGVDGRAPFTDVLTHGWVLDAEGRAMHKSLGNVMAPEKVIERYGAEIVRWWALSTDWRTDVRVGDETLARVADAYRKVRNTFRFLLGNLADFGPADALAPGRLTRVDRVFAGHLAARVARLREDSARFLFHRVADGLLDLCTVDLSAVFLDVAKDRLYTLAPGDPARRSAQTVLWRALRDLTVAASPLLAFTAEEVWQHHPGLLAEAESVHLAEWAETPVEAGAEEAWAFLHDVRDRVNAAIEPKRAAKEFATTAEAEVTITAPAAWLARLEPYRDELPGFLLVARVTLATGADGREPEVQVARTALARCERCWTHRADVAADGPRAGLCARCRAVLETARS
ncbi:MAG: isoleucine--tRNA ligase [Candidatus Eisenbacteria bacterium]|uniref:Isoleucine--tRNA ligase n=1 Tax=Eiseniibacteriota bacterium TaxID=2212470 RepID=A0A9D6QJ13_UNCEI|nr:isoleucine--tRNA ligase [Candidatus Eisenbacteria bacterium]